MNSSFDESCHEECCELVNGKQKESSEDSSTSQTKSCKSGSLKTSVAELQKNQGLVYLSQRILQNGKKQFYYVEIRPHENMWCWKTEVNENFRVICIDLERDVKRFKVCLQQNLEKTIDNLSHSIHVLEINLSEVLQNKN